MKNVLILEDKKSHLEALNKIISEMEINVRVFLAANIETAYQIAMGNHIHLFLLDIILRPEKPGDVLGLNFARELREVKKFQFTPIIFITSLEDPKFYSYSQLHCFGYIEKPFSVERVQSLVRQALEFPNVTNEERAVYFRKDGIIYSKDIKDIIYIENSRRKVVIHCKNDVLEIAYKTCEEILKEIDSELFIQCSRFAIVNRKYVEQVDFANRYIKLRFIDEPVEIGAIMKNKFKRRWDEWN